MSEVVHFERRGDVALITIDSPPVNSLSTAVVEGLFARVAEANADAGIRAMVITGARENFIAGADITGLQALAEGKGKVDSQNIGSLTAKLEELEANAKPVVMAIDGFALGGGLEVAMAGQWRVGTTRCRCGLPELTLGIIPGAAGTQRLPRIVGVQKATEMMLTSAEVRGKEVLELGIVQELVEPDKLIDAAIAAARKLADGHAQPVRASKLNDKIGTVDQAKMIMQGATMLGGDKLRNLVHPHLCMDAILTGVTDGYAAGLKREAENFAKCLASPQAAGMIHIFFATRAAPKVPGVTDQKFEPKAIKRVAVLGGGTMGSGIATSLLQSGFEVVLKEVNTEFVEAGRGRIQANLESRVKKGKLAQDKYEQMLARLTPQIEYAGFDKVDMVIEAVIENIDLKQSVFVDLEKAVRPDCILASNTSTIDLEVIGAKTKAQDRILGTHFFSPAHVMPLVEVVRSKQTSPQALNSAINLVKQLKKTPVTVGNCVGFLVNRIFFPYGQTALLLVDNGVDLYRLDKAVYDWGMPMGPFRMSDLAGVDVAKFAGGILAKAYSEHNYVSTLVDYLFEAKRFGEKTKVGYYKYDGKKALPDPELAGFVAKARADAGNPPAMELSDNDIVEHVLFGVVNEACRCLDEGIAIRPSDIDVACVMGMGFPAYRGGIMKWADTLGAKYIYDKLLAWSKKYGPVYEPSDYLKRKAEKGESLMK
ncbi:MAG TPA: 3-hydroxyacyl-CoA dehydrogenase NAD-binding domain-containing protein [Pirellulales bacterium]|jgi:enoyl-CoA hydratase/3-hydroxyacyl-CoA dehydrogenase